MRFHLGITSRVVVPDMYSAVRARVQATVDEASTINFTSDVWTNDNNLNAFLSLTGHWIDESWNRRYAFLKLHSLESPHTGLVISNSFNEILSEWGITEERRGILVRDNGSSMVAAAHLSGLTDLGCYIHTIQLVVNAALRPTVQRAVGDIIATGSLATTTAGIIIPAMKMHVVRIFAKACTSWR